MEFALKPMDFTLKAMDVTLKMLEFILKMVDSGRWAGTSRIHGGGRRSSAGPRASQSCSCSATSSTQ